LAVDRRRAHRILERFTLAAELGLMGGTGRDRLAGSSQFFDSLSWNCDGARVGKRRCEGALGLRYWTEVVVATPSKPNCPGAAMVPDGGEIADADPKRLGAHCPWGKSSRPGRVRYRSAGRRRLAMTKAKRVADVERRVAHRKMHVVRRAARLIRVQGLPSWAPLGRGEQVGCEELVEGRRRSEFL